MRWVIVRVLPVPAPARMHTGPVTADAAVRCSSSRPASTASAPAEVPAAGATRGASAVRGMRCFLQWERFSERGSGGRATAPVSVPAGTDERRGHPAPVDGGDAWGRGDATGVLPPRRDVARPAPTDPSLGGPRVTAAPAAVTMYTTTWCGYCVRLKKLMQVEGIDYAEVDIERDAAAADVV